MVDCDCAFGITGYQGQAGQAGRDGLRGFQGYQGWQGELGIRGAVGSQGLSGTEGLDGRAGPIGYPGADGQHGQYGIPGPVGPPGQRGPPGECGVDGAPGPIGLRGYEGAAGPRGPAGVPGARGDRGFQGVLGNQGMVGAQGSVADFNLIMEAAKSKTGVATSTVSVSDGDKVRLWSAGGLAISLSSGSALYNLEPNNMISSAGNPALAPSDPFRPSLYIDTTTSKVWLWDPNVGGGGLWIQQTGNGAIGYFGGCTLIKVSNIVPQFVNSPVMIDLLGSVALINLVRNTLVRLDVFLVVSCTSGYTLTGNFYQDGLEYDGDPALMTNNTFVGTQTIQHSNSKILSTGTYELKYQLHVGIGESVTIEQMYFKISLVSA